MKKTLVVDLHNLAHRIVSVTGKRQSEDPKKDEGFFITLVLNSIISAMNVHKPDSVVMVKEGSPTFRYEIYPEYKKNRKVKPDDPEANAKTKRIMQLHEYVKKLEQVFSQSFNVTYIKHGKLEADDLIANYVWYLRDSNERAVVLSNDKDFAQLLWNTPNDFVQVWNPSKKCFLEVPTCDPVVQKSLMGDVSDNIDGVPGFGKKRAFDAASKLGSEFEPSTSLSPENYEIYSRNMKLVKFAELKPSEWSSVDSIQYKGDYGGFLVNMNYYESNSFLGEKGFEKYMDTFATLKHATLPKNVR